MTPPMTPQAKCHHAIRHAFSAAIAEYFTRNPEMLSDQPKVDAAAYAMLKLMDNVLAIVDRFEIADRPVQE